jgi:hypothetical protein
VVAQMTSGRLRSTTVTGAEFLTAACKQLTTLCQLGKTHNFEGREIMTCLWALQRFNHPRYEEAFFESVLCEVKDKMSTFSNQVRFIELNQSFSQIRVNRVNFSFDSPL